MDARQINSGAAYVSLVPFLAIQREGLAFTYQDPGEAPWATESLQNLGLDIKFLAQTKIVQPPHGSQTIQHNRVWKHPLEIIYEKLRIDARFLAKIRIVQKLR